MNASRPPHAYSPSTKRRIPSLQYCATVFDAAASRTLASATNGKRRSRPDKTDREVRAFLEIPFKADALRSPPHVQHKLPPETILPDQPVQPSLHQPCFSPPAIVDAARSRTSWKACRNPSATTSIWSSAIAASGSRTPRVNSSTWSRRGRTAGRLMRWHAPSAARRATTQIRCAQQPRLALAPIAAFARDARQEPVRSAIDDDLRPHAVSSAARRSPDANRSTRTLPVSGRRPVRHRDRLATATKPVPESDRQPALTRSAGTKCVSSSQKDLRRSVASRQNSARLARSACSPRTAG